MLEIVWSKNVDLALRWRFELFGGSLDAQATVDVADISIVRSPLLEYQDRPLGDCWCVQQWVRTGFRFNHYPVSKTAQATHADETTYGFDGNYLGLTAVDEPIHKADQTGQRHENEQVLEEFGHAIRRLDAATGRWRVQ